MNPYRRVTHRWSLDLSTEAAKVVEEIAPELDRDAAAVVARAVLQRLTEDDVANELAAAIHSALSAAAAAASEYPDLYENALYSSGVTAEVATNAVQLLLRGGNLVAGGLGGESTSRDPRRDVTRLCYRDWRFELVRMGDGVGLRVVAELEDTYKSEKSFRTSRVVAVEDDLITAAFRAVMQVEEHEVRERLLYDGVRVLDPHLTDAVWPATNLRQTNSEEAQPG